MEKLRTPLTANESCRGLMGINSNENKSLMTDLMDINSIENSICN